MALEIDPTSLFLQNPCVVTSTSWKFESIKDNLETFVEKYFRMFAVPMMNGYLDNVVNVPISVEEKDTMIGSSDLIEQKAIDQVIKMWSMSRDPISSAILPKEFVDIVENGGVFSTVATDVAGREIWINENGERVGKWRRILNFSYSGDPKSMSVVQMREELERYCDKEYGIVGRPAARAVDATLGLTKATFDVRTSTHRKLGRYDAPAVSVYSGRETLGIIMETHPLSSPSLRKMFFDQHVEKCRLAGMSVKDAYTVFNGRAGLARTEDLVAFLRKNQIGVKVQLPEIDVIANEEEAIRTIAEGGSYQLFASVLLYAKTHPRLDNVDGFLVIREPKNSSMIAV